MMIQITKQEVHQLLKLRETTSNKSDYGHALLIAGKTGYMGAAVIAAKACLRSGTGLLTLAVPSVERSIVQMSIPEAMVVFRDTNEVDFKRFSAVGIGPGIGTDEDATFLVKEVLNNCKKPLILDADALYILATNSKVFDLLPADAIITPHSGEFDRLFGTHKTNDQRIATGIKQAKKRQINIVLKGHQTTIITPTELFFNDTGNAGLAKGGSGDALTGMLTSFLAQGYKPLTAAKIAVFLHGFAADITLNEQSMESMLITDVINNLGKAFEIVKA